jgi:thermostable 8-oxoguanine DNA glycosylase
MIDPDNITKFDRTEEELQEFLLFCVLVQGKQAKIQSVKLNYFLAMLIEGTGFKEPFQALDAAKEMELNETTFLEYAMRKVKLGQYNRLSQAIDDFLNLPPLSLVKLEELENCFAVGPKSARFFLLHSRPNQKFAVLDVHVLRWLGLKGHKVPKNTPQGKLYGEIERLFLTYCNEAILSVAELDLEIWKAKGQLA